MITKNKIFTFDYTRVLPAAMAAAVTHTIDAPFPNRYAKVKSILYDVRLWESVSGRPIPYSDNRDVLIKCVLYNLDADHFINLPGGASSGTRLILYNPVAMFYDSFIVANNIDVWFEWQNFNALDSIDAKVNLSIELEIIDLI